MPVIHFKTTLFNIGSWTILKLPESASLKLSSRGQVMVKGAINGYNFQAPLEPDGKWGHWLKVDKAMKKETNAGAGDSVTVVIEPMKDWPEPDVPEDIKNALDDDPQVLDLWKKITPMARWEWIRWIRGTAQQETRKRRIGVAMSKLKSGERRPCCWNRALCTEPYVSKSGILLEPNHSNF